MLSRAVLVTEIGIDVLFLCGRETDKDPSVKGSKS